MEKDLLKRRLEREKVWRKTVEEWQASGQSQVDFCREKGLKENTFSCWKKVIEKRDREKEQKRVSGTKAAKVSAQKGAIAPMTFLTLAETAQPPKSKNLQMVLPNGVAVVIPAELAIANLSRLIAAVERL
jgi:hypothetical protein